MPKKVKSKKKGKGKGKGKGKKGKGKKGKKSGDKPDKETILKEALATAKLWEARYTAVDHSRQQYRDQALRLVGENDTLQSAINKTEKDTIEVISFLKKEDASKDEEVSSLRASVRDLKHGAHKQWSTKEQHFSDKISELEEDVKQKDEELGVMQGELKTMREFRRKRAEMQDHLTSLQQTLDNTVHQHQSQLSLLEQRFFEEKVRLQNEANRRIQELATHAHTQAIANLDERTRSVYRENAQMAEALSLHMTEEQSLRAEKERLEIANRQLAAEKELSQQLAQEKVSQAQQHKKLIRQLQEKVSALEQSLTLMVREFEKEKEVKAVQHKKQLQSSQAELQILKRQNELQQKETAHIKKLARQLLDQRTELEQFFLDSLAHVKKEIETNRMEYQRDAQRAYRRRVLEAVEGKREFPPVRTFHRSSTSTNSVFHDMEMAERWDGVSGSVDISDLSWEQREQVLRLLFAKMNIKKQPRHVLKSPRALPPITTHTDDSQPIETLPPIPTSSHQSTKDSVFITQQHLQPEQTNTVVV